MLGGAIPVVEYGMLCGLCYLQQGCASTCTVDTILPCVCCLVLCACHAALLPCLLMQAQGTTCVFSKKVEYLHSLVYQALETIFNKKQKERQAAANKNKV